MKKYSLPIVSILATAVLLFLTVSLSAQNQTTADDPVIRFDYLKFQKPIPYQRPFYVRGSRMIYQTKVDGGTARIFLDGQKIDSAKWWTSTRDDVDFNFHIVKGLEFNKEYKFEFEFYQNVTLDTALTKASLKSELINNLNAKIAVDTKLLYSDMMTLLNTTFAEFNNSYNSVNPTANSNTRANLSLYNRNLVANDLFLWYNLQLDLKTLAGKLSTAKNDYDRLSTAIDSLKSIIYSTPPVDDVGKYLSAIPPAATPVAAIKTRVHTTNAEFAAMLKVVENLRNVATPSKTIVQVHGFIRDKLNLPIGKTMLKPLYNGPTALAPATLDSLDGYAIIPWKKTLERIEKLIGPNTVSDGKIDEVISLQTQIDNKQKEVSLRYKSFQSNFRLVNEKDLVQFKGTFTSSSKTEVVTVTELETLRFSPVVGLATTPLNINGNIDWRLFGFLAVKYYFGPVDKRVTRPYLTGNRWSAMAGVLVGNDFAYKGQHLDNAGLGTRPIIGFGYDAGELISINLGLVLFQQASVNPLFTGSKLAMSPFASLTLDADLFNRLKSLFSGNKYSLPQ